MKLSQPLEALGVANHVRTTRAALRRQVKKGELHVADLLEDLPPECHKMPAVELLSWAPRVGRYRSKLLLKELTFVGTDPERVIVGQMHPQKRAALVERCREAVA